MKKLLLLLPLTFLPVQSHAITWDEFWRPFEYGNNYSYGNYYYGTRPRMCDRRVYREQYVPGDRYRNGYVRRWYESVRMPCHLRY